MTHGQFNRAIGYALACLLVVRFVGLASIGNSSPATDPAGRPLSPADNPPETPPAYLTESVPNVPAGSKTYQFWYSTNCNGGTTCECDNINDIDTDDDTVNDTDSPNDCIATIDSNMDGIPETGLDSDNDGLPNVLDPDWGSLGTSVVESVPLAVQNTLSRYTSDWGLKDPLWVSDTNRGIYIFDIDARGFAGNGRVDYDTGTMLGKGPEPRGTVLHELWHRTQFAYGVDAGTWLIEGQARFLQDKVFDDLDNRIGSRYHDSVNTYLGNPTYVNKEDRDDDGTDEFYQADGVFGASYNASLWWTYLADQAGSQFTGTAGEGMDFLIDILHEAEDNDRQSVDAVDYLLRDKIDQGFDATFWDFTIANYAKDFDVDAVKTSAVGGRDPKKVLKYSDEKRTTVDPLIYGPVTRTLISATQMLTGASGTVAAMSADVSDPNAMSQYGALYYEGDLLTACQLAYWRVIGDPGADLFHSFLVIRGDTNANGAPEVVSLLRSQGDKFARAVWNNSSSYTKIAGIVTAANDPYGYTWEMGCTHPHLDIVLPTTAAPAYVGTPTDPGRFLVWLSVTGDGGTSDYVEGLDWTRDFSVSVGVDAASILNGGYVQNQYWLLVQAPNKPGSPLGTKFNLTVRLGPGAGIQDVENQAIIYDVLTSDQVVVIDRSGSMADNSKLDSAKTAGRLFSDVVQRFDMLGVASFSDDATQEYALTSVPDQNDAGGIRAAAKAKIDLITSGGATSIGDGLKKGQDMLDASGDPDHQWIMVLLSDGMENTPQSWNNVKNGIINATTKVHAIALGKDADEELMREIAESTCGAALVDLCYHYIEESGVSPGPPGSADSANAAEATGLANGLADIFRRAQETIAGQQRLWQSSGTATSLQVINVTIAEAGVRNAFFSFNWEDAAHPLTLSINGPSALTVQLNDTNHKVFYANSLLPGTYQVTMSSPSGASPWIGSLSGRLVAGTELHVFLENDTENRRPGQPIRLQASVSDNSGPVRGATVQARIHHPDGDVDVVTLVDDGGRYDDLPEDGVYGYIYDRINRPLALDVLLGHTWVIDVEASGFNNSHEAFRRYTELAYTPNLSRERTLDADNDTMLDVWENRFNGPNSAIPDNNVDSDKDGLTNKQEFERGTNPDDPDTDRGGETDGSEVAHGRNPLLTSDDVLPRLVDFWIENLTGEVELHFNKRPQYQQMRVYRRTGAVGSFNLLGAFDPSEGVITDTGLINDQDYFYFLQPLGASGVTGAPTRVLYAEPALDPFQPEAEIMINNDATYTSNKNVTLQFGGLTLPGGELDTRFVQISNTPDLRFVPWVAYQQERPWVINPNAVTGQAFVYVRLRDAAGNVSDVIYGDGIIYKPKQFLPPGGIKLSNITIDIHPPYFNNFIFAYTPQDAPVPGPSGTITGPGGIKLYSAGVTFDLEAKDAGGAPVTQFTQFFTIEIQYEDWQWQNGGIASEASLNLYYNNGGGWMPILPCAGCTHDRTNNLIRVRLNHLTQFALLGQPRLFEDLDRDGDVDATDLIRAAGAWRSIPGDFNYDAAVDLHTDGHINIADLQRVAGQLGPSGPR